MRAISGVCSGTYTEEATFMGIERFKIERDTAFPVLTESRVVRTFALPVQITNTKP